MNKKLERIISKYVYIKLCFQRSFSHLNVPFQVFNFLMLVSVWIKLYFDGKISYIVIPILGCVIIISLFVIGHIDLRMNVMSKELSLANKYNPEIQKILEQGEK